VKSHPSDVLEAVRIKEFDEAVERGRANAEAIELTRRYCRHARIQPVGGNSMVGTMMGLPMGLLEVRCEHAPPPRTQGHDALGLALAFYEVNCVGCPYRNGTGELPSLSTIAVARATEREARETAERQAAEGRAHRHRERLAHRRLAVAGEGYVVRELAAAVDLIDRPDPRTQPLTDAEESAARRVIDSARGAPELFSPVLVDSLLELATDAADATAFDALGALVRAGRCPPRRALEAALAVLRLHRSPAAGGLMARLEPELRPDDLPAVLDELIALASGEDDDLWRPRPAPEGLIAASRVDLTEVTGRIAYCLSSDDDAIREAAAEAAGILLAIDPARVIALGAPLAASVRGPDAGYAGYPHPAGAGLRALAEAWRGEPALTRRIVESHAVAAPDESRGQLARVPWFLQRFREPWDAGAAATSEAVAFLVRRAAGDWGDEAADRAAEHLTHLATDLSAIVAAHAGELLGAILLLCAPDRDTATAASDRSADPAVAALERASLRIRRDTRRRRLAQAVGRCASVKAAEVIAAVQALFSATTGDDDHDRAVRTAMIDVLEEAVSSETLRDVLPITYSALMDRDQVVRSAGIDLWAACADVADTLPMELTELSVALLQDSYVVVHRGMLGQLPRLRVPGDLTGRLLPIVAGWVITYSRANDPAGLEPAVWALWSLAHRVDDDAQALGWYRIALDHVGGCSPWDRQRLLTAGWPAELYAEQAWTKAALATSASAELIDYYNQRREPLLQELFDHPQRLADVPLTEIQPLSDVHGQAHPWRALEPVELLEAAGRWADAAVVARAVENRQPRGEEGGPGRRLAGVVADGAELGQTLLEKPPATDAVRSQADAVRAAAAAIEGSVSGGVRDGPLRQVLDSLLAEATAVELLLDPVVADPAALAGELEGAADLLAGTPAVHASGMQRHWIARAWRIAALLLRYDAAARHADPQARAMLQAAQRQAEVLEAELAQAEAVPVPPLIDFLQRVRDTEDPGGAQAAWRLLPHATPPACLVGTSLSAPGWRAESQPTSSEEPPRAVCVPTWRGIPVTDILVVRPRELHHLGMTVRLVAMPDWAETCIVEPITALGREALALPRYEFSIRDATVDEFGVMLTGEEPLHCGVEQPILAPALDCPIQVRLTGKERDEVIETAGCRRLRLRPFDPGRDRLTEHEQTDHRLLEMFARLDAPDFDTEDVRAFVRLFGACVRAAQVIMFERTFRAGSRVTEAQFHDELERLLRADPELEGRLTRRDAVAGGFDDLLHDDVIAELKVSRGIPVTVEDCARWVGQPTQYGVGRGSQLSVLVVLDHGRKIAPPGVIDNYIGWLRPRLHGQPAPRYPSLLGVLIVNTNLPIPSTWSRRRVTVEADRGPAG
jgi:hypothetical protein